MQSPVLLLCISIPTLAMAAQPQELKDMAQRIAPRVRVDDDAAFFAAWNLDCAGMEAVRAAVDAGDYARARAELKAYFLRRRAPKWKINHWRMPAKPKGPAAKHSRYGEGEKVLAHQFSGGGFSVDFGDKIDWNYFPKKLPNGRRDTEYPVTHYINRFGHFSRVLGPLYWYSLDERYAKEFVYEVTDHVESHPPPEKHHRDVAGPWSRLTACVPLLGSWLDGYNYFLRSDCFTPAAHAIMLKGFIQKARYAVRNPDGVNRYMAQLAGIYNVGAYFPELKQADAFRAFAVQAMAAAAADEFYPDSISKELCPGYHGGSAAAPRRIIESARIMGCDPPQGLLDGLEATYDFYPKVVTPLGGLPQFGDTWGAGNVSRTLRAVRAGFVDKPVYRWFATGGKEGEAPAFTSTRLPWAGFYVMRSGWGRDALYLCMDAGPLGKGHWHEDKLNFVCFAYGEPLVAEVGIYSYTVSKWNQYFRASDAHNVVLVDGLGQDRACDGGMRPVSEPRTDDWHSDDVFGLAWGDYDGKWVACEHYGGWFNRFGKDHAAGLATHRRDICFVKNSFWIVSDRLAAAGEHRYSQLFHFLPDRTVRVLGAGRAGTDDPRRANVLLIQADRVEARTIEGQEEPIQGWCSPKQGEVVPAPVISFDQTATDRALYDTIVLPLKPGEEPNLTVERLPVRDENGEAVSPHHVCALRITSRRGCDYYINDLRQREIGPPNGKTKRAGDVETDARAAVVRTDVEGEVLAASAVAGSFLRFRGKAAHIAAP